jgi:hypothetical protein
VGNGPFPAAQPLHDWIPLKEFDIYAIGLQECSRYTLNMFSIVSLFFFQKLNFFLDLKYTAAIEIRGFLVSPI